MTNINKYWIVMESLDFYKDSKDHLTGKEERLKQNLKILQSKIKLSPNDVIQSIIESLNLQHMDSKQFGVGEIIDDKYLYCLYSLKMLLEICTNINFASDAKEALVSEKHKSLIVSSIADVAAYALQENLHKTFYKEKAALFARSCETESNYFQLHFLMEALSPLIFLKTLQWGKSFDDVQLWYMASIFSLLVAYDLKEYNLDQSDIDRLQAKLQKMWLELSKNMYYRNLMLLYSSLPKIQRQRIHREMLLRLWSPGGFQALLFAMADSTQRSDDQSLDETVANLVAQPTFSIKGQHSLIQQIFQFLEINLKNKQYSALMGAGILSLKKLYDNNNENKDFIKKLMLKKMEPLITNDDASKIVAMEWPHFVDLISLMFHIFCTSSVATLPSELLVCYFPVILELYSQIESHANQDTLIGQLSALILKTLNNRSKEELKVIVECVAFKKYPPEWYQLCFNIQIKENTLNIQELKINLVDDKVAPLSIAYKHPLASLVAILKNSSHTLLTYQHFLLLLQMVPSLILDSNAAAHNSNTDLLDTEDVCNKILREFTVIYEDKMQIVKALEALVQHQSLKTLMNDNITSLLKSLQDILEAFSKSFCVECKETETVTTVLMILLVLIREIVENCVSNAEHLQVNLLRPIKQLESQVENENLKYQLRCLLRTIKGADSVNGQQNGTSKDVFEEARLLIEAPESFLQVQGIEMMIKLLNKQDEYAVTNKHVLIALALNTLKSPESYTFLNCVRLFVALVNVESDVLEILSDEYLNEAASMDYRLVIGEAIVETSREIGPLCYKYKNVLLNNFMAGCRSPLHEFRLSAFSNLSQMCRQLAYQVHNYFQELLNLIDCELTTGNYLPAKRAAVMVLSELLAGMDNLFDYEEMLLPIYRLLKHLAAAENNDEKVRIHALNGLKCLSEKCQELLKTSLEQHGKDSVLTKEIKIMGINDKSERKLKHHILEMN